MNPFNSINKIKDAKGKMEANKKQRETREQERNEEYYDFRGLNNLTEQEKEIMEKLKQDNETLTRYPVKGTEAEVTSLDMLQIIIEQNNIIIGLLGAIRNKE